MSDSSSASARPEFPAEPGDRDSGAPQSSVPAQSAIQPAVHPAAHPFVYLGRQPILDRNGALSAYELLFRGGPQNRADVFDDALATAQVMTRTMGQLGVPAVLGRHHGYVNMSRELLFDDIVHLLPPERFVLEVLEHVGFDTAVLERLAQLRRAGYRIAFDDVNALTDGLRRALPYADIVKVDLMQTGREALPALAAAIAAEGKTLIAEKVETREDFEYTRELGFDLFQGYFFARPQVLRAPKVRASRLALVRLLALVAGDVGIAELEHELRSHPGVVVQLLRLVNSSAYAPGRPISSLREAVLAAGTRQIARWAQLLLYASGRDLPWSSDPLVQLAGTRSHFMELAARSLAPNDADFADAAFMTGIFSLVHVLVGSTPAHTLERLGLSREISEAVDGQRGELGMLLRVAEAAEQGDDQLAQSLVAQAGGRFEALTPPLLGELNLWASAWFSAYADG
ncbi:EAL and modified HD-GYP domain-containing signal transduction protein [Paraburkholderia eburnea]|uniref:EAL and modified HD-GYP domain-containing signal transduction protein n=1 Tax=Paraburkholderia eburnea TaxID=1189126 RepID=A0A2S4LUA3_9BURK|nr:EAL domain-containing protein [Paraburkholderia eburnea]POR46043.1 EAL and modified HD-GYP domain-containing signal transduction protein [Paraburkholderia eburnea]PRZ15753.1 EAL and modified HD-GYP domain-containing signal transduction protein [Paraburkholderia eburnea]